MNERPRFSIVICNHDYGRFVGEAVRSCLAQDYPRELFEVIVVDDGSTDDSREVLRGFAGEPNVTVIEQDNQGQAGAFMAGIARARHDLVCFLDSDDFYLPGKLSAVAARIEALAPLPEHFFLCHDVEVYDDARGEPIERTWLEMMDVPRLGPMLHIDQATRDFPFAIPCGQVMRLATACAIANSLPSWEWRSGADSAFAQAAFLIAGVVHYVEAPLARYRVHGNNNYAAVRDGRFAPRPLWVQRWPRLARFLEQLTDSIDLDARERASRIAHIKRLERTTRHTSSRLRFAESMMSFVVGPDAVDADALAATVEACLSQSHPKVEVILVGGAAAGAAALPERLRDQVRPATPGATPFEDCRRGYARAGGDYVCFLAAGDLPDAVFAERHLFVHRYGAICHLTSSDFRVVDPRGVMLHSNVMHTAGAWRRSIENAMPFDAPLEQWTFPPFAANVLRRSEVLENLLETTLEGDATALSGNPGWLLLNVAHHLAGSVRINECLLSLRVHGPAEVTYARLLAPMDAHGIPDEPDVDVAAALLVRLFARGERRLRRQLTQAWWEAFANWIRDERASGERAVLARVAADSGGPGLARLLADG